MYFSWKSSADLRELKALIRFVREQSFYEYSLSTAVSFPIYGQKTKCNMRFLYIPRPICHENPLIFVATSLLLIQNGKKIRGEKKEREREKRKKKQRKKKGNKGEKCRGEKNHKSILLLFFQLHLWAIVTVTSQTVFDLLPTWIFQNLNVNKLCKCFLICQANNYLLCLGLALLSVQLCSL